MMIIIIIIIINKISKTRIFIPLSGRIRPTYEVSIF
jgi:hypothetical protein